MNVTAERMDELLAPHARVETLPWDRYGIAPDVEEHVITQLLLAADPESLVTGGREAGQRATAMACAAFQAGVLVGRASCGGAT